MALKPIKLNIKKSPQKFDKYFFSIIIYTSSWISDLRSSWWIQMSSFTNYVTGKCTPFALITCWMCKSFYTVIYEST